MGMRGGWYGGGGGRGSRWGTDEEARRVRNARSTLLRLYR